MKILLINDYGTPTGGAELALLTLRARLRGLGHDARLFTSGARPGGARSLADYQCLGTTSRWRTLLQSANPWAYWRLRQVLAEFRPDVVHVRIFLTQLSPLILPLLRDVPTVYHVAWYRPICPLGTKRLPDGHACAVRWGAACRRNGCLPWRDWLPLMMQMRLWWRWRDAFNVVVAESRHVQAQLGADGLGPVEIVPTGVPVRPLRPPLVSPPTVAFAGRLVPEKGADILVRAFARVAERIPAARLVIAGDGPERARLQQLVDAHPFAGRVVLTGALDREELERQFAGAWVQAVPSLWAEPFGLVAVEAMMRGTAVVATGTGGLAEIVQEGRTGFHVPPGDVAALADRLLAVLQDRDLAERLGRAGREVALGRYDEAACAKNFLRLYPNLCSNQKVTAI